MESGKRELSRVSDYELEKQYNSLHRLVNGNKFSKEKKVKLETELCYLQRELFIRKARKAAHEKYQEERKAARYHHRR